MKNFKLQMAMAIVALISATVLQVQKTAQAGVVLPPPSNPLPGLRPVPSVRPRACPDLAARSISVSLVRTTGDFSGRIRIEGIVRNIGFAAFRSSRGQQSVDLLEVPLSGLPQVIARQSFTSLASGATLRVSQELYWDAAMEFQPSYRLEVSYDPDIRMDGNLDNDDCNHANDWRERPAEDINALFND